MKKPRFRILNFHLDTDLRMSILKELKKIRNVDVYCAGSMFEALFLPTLVSFDACICGPSATANDFLKKIDTEKITAQTIVIDLKKTIPKINDGQLIHVNSVELLIEVVKKEIEMSQALKSKSSVPSSAS